MNEILARLDRWLAANRPNYYVDLLPGVDDAALDAFDTRFSLRLTQEFRELYKWRNGEWDDVHVLEGNRRFMSLKEIIERKELLDSMIGFDFEEPEYWRRGWVPFLHNGGGSHLCLDLSAEDGGVPGQLIGFWKADHDRPIEYPSVNAWLTALVTKMENGMLEFE